MTTTKEINGNIYKVIRTSYIDRTYKGENIYKNLFKVYKNDSLVKEFTSNKNGNQLTTEGFDSLADKVVVICINPVNGFESFKCLKDEKAVKKQAFYTKEKEGKEFFIF